MERIRPARQIYSNYTQEDFSVWKTLFHRQMEILQHSASASFLEALDKVDFRAERIPEFENVNRILEQTTGWGIVTVPNICPEKDFFKHLSQKEFTSTCWLRTMEELDYLEEPDMFHDVFGHVPLLTNDAYVGFFKGLSQIALEYDCAPDVIVLLSRLYWFTIEFGMIREYNELKIYGAGIISSHGETLHCLSEATTHLPFDVATVMNTPYRTDILQESYFVIESFEQLYGCLNEIHTCLNQMLGNKMMVKSGV